MRLVLHNHSSYPRVGEGPDAQRLRRAYAQRETGKIDQAAFDAVADDYAAEIIAEQEAAGLDVVTDGQVWWYDVMAHPAGRLDGIAIRGLVRFFDTNTYVRQPEPTGAVSGRFGLDTDFARGRAVAERTLKVAVTGPYTLARHSLADSDFLNVATAYAEALSRDLEALDAAGASIVQIDEPSLLRQPEDAELVRNLLRRATATKGSMTTILTTYFGASTPLYGELMDMPVDIVGFDLVYDHAVVDAIVHHGADRPVALGAVDARNTKLDDVSVIAQNVERAMEALGSRGVEEIHLQPSAGLEFLPRDRALRKLQLLDEIRAKVAA